MTLPKIIVYTNQELSFCVHSVSNTDVSCQKNRVVVPKQRTASIPLVTLTLIHSLIQSVAGRSYKGILINMSKTLYVPAQLTAKLYNVYVSLAHY